MADAIIATGGPQSAPATRNTFQESREDWLVVATSTIGLAVSVIYVYSMGLFIAPLEAEFGWPRGQISAGLTVVSVITVVLAPIIGMAIDRYGSRVIALSGMVLYCLAFGLLATTSASIWHWWALWGLIGLGVVLIKPTVWMAAVASRFKTRRGLAIGLALCGTGVGSATMPWVASSLIQAVGWRYSYLALALGGAIVALPLMLAFFRDNPRVRPAVGAPSGIPGITIREGLTSRRFQKMALASFLATFGVIALVVHFVPILVSQGVASKQAAVVAGAIGLASIAGRIGTGFVLDRIHGTFVGAIGFGMPVVACVLLLNADGSTALTVSAALVLGLSLGAEIDVIAYLATRYFGLRNYGMLFGSLAGLLSLGTGVGAAFGGAMFDRFGTYDALIWSLIPVFATTTLLVVTLGAYPTFDEPESLTPSHEAS